ncbi:MAG: hypothetical protein Q4A18_02110 [Rikenellaceae bacterium]|nr:hypothetical protein [Rikenellaceae bacterium]
MKQKRSYEVPRTELVRVLTEGTFASSGEQIVEESNTDVSINRQGGLESDTGFDISGWDE